MANKAHHFNPLPELIYKFYSVVHEGYGKIRTSKLRNQTQSESESENRGTYCFLFFVFYLALVVQYEYPVAIF